MIHLSVNVNKVATLRNSRGGHEPSVLEAVEVCLAAGVSGITVHPRVDVGYTAKYSLNGGNSWRDVAGVVTIAGPASDLEVVEARPVLVGNG